MSVLFTLTQSERDILLHIARASVEEATTSGFIRSSEAPNKPSDALRHHGASFVTLRKNADLRGCIGSLHAYRPLIDDVKHNAVAAATQDPRFPRVEPHELESLRYSISVLEPPRTLDVSTAELPNYLATNHPGVILEIEGRRSTFLPSVWKELPDPEEFLACLCRKQGTAPNRWKEPGVLIQTYGSIYFGDTE